MNWKDSLKVMLFVKLVKGIICFTNVLMRHILGGKTFLLR